MAVVTSLGIGQFISCLMLLDFITSMHTNSTLACLRSTNIVTLVYNQLAEFQPLGQIFQLMMQTWKIKDLHLLISPNSSQINILKKMLFPTRETQFHINGSFCVLAFVLFFIHFENSVWRTSQKMLFILATAEHRWIWAPATELCCVDSSKITCRYVTHINIITLVKQPEAAQQWLKRMLLERKDES